jgi:hypothetical protein
MELLRSGEAVSFTDAVRKSGASRSTLRERWDRQKGGRELPGKAKADAARVRAQRDWMNQVLRGACETDEELADQAVREAEREAEWAEKDAKAPAERKAQKKAEVEAAR